MGCLRRGKADVCPPAPAASAGVLALAVLTLLGAARSPGALASADHVLLTPGADAITLRRALAGARRKLERPECRQVLTDFTNQEGQPLQQKLDGFGVSAAQYLDLVFFSDGERVTDRAGRCPCRQPGIVAVTQPGGRVVHVCARQFVDVDRGDSGLAENLLLHEMLHSLGLGENPPTPGEITRRVRARCGS
jgi:hypothetical protein